MVTGNFWKPATNFFRGVNTAAPAKNPTTRGNSSGGWGEALRKVQVVTPMIEKTIDPNTGLPMRVNANTLAQGDKAYLQGTSYFNRPGGLPTAPGAAASSGGGGGRGGGGGGGGGGAAGMNQAQMDWLMGLLGRGAPQAQAATNLDLPDYTGTFDPTMYNELEGKLGTAVGQSRGAADEAYGNLQNYLTSNYQNAFGGGAPQQQQMGANQQAMQRMLASQGVGNESLAANQQGAAAGNAAFGNIWALLAGNEDRAQQNRLNRVQTDRGTTNRALDAAQLQGQTGIGLQRGQAQTAFNERSEQMRNQIAQQEALANWTRANQVSDTNAQNTAAYRNQMIQSLLGLVPSMAQGVQLPDLASLGL